LTEAQHAKNDGLVVVSCKERKEIRKKKKDKEEI